MTDERPTLSVAVPCPTCGGKVWMRRKDDHPEFGHHCPDCTDGTIRQAVSCQSCKWWERIPDDPGAINGGECTRLHIMTTAAFGCLSWEAKA